MKKVLVIFFLFFVISNFHGYGFTPTDLRKKFYLSVDDYNVAKSFLKELESIKNASPLETGYKAAVSMVMAKHVYNPYSKLKYFMDGKAQLEQAIASDSQNTELRLIRFAIQTNAPGFLGYQSHLTEDKKMLMDVFKQTNSDAEFKKIVKTYLLESKHTTAKEKELIKDM